MFGNGDGGGGPSAVMLERLRRTRAAGLHSDRSGEQLPLVKTGFSLSDFFESTRKKTDNGKSLPAWYVLEPTNTDDQGWRAVPRTTSGCADFSSPDQTQFSGFGTSDQGSRVYLDTRLHPDQVLLPQRGKLLSFRLKSRADDQRFDNLWESLCLCMFHDTLPGSSIHIAVEDYDRKFAAIHKTAKELFDEAAKALGGSADSNSVINTLPSHPRKEVVSLGSGEVGVAETDAHTLCGKAERYEPSESKGVTGMS